MIPSFINNFSSIERQNKVLERTRYMMENANYVLAGETEMFELEFSEKFAPNKRCKSVANATIALELIFLFYLEKVKKSKKIAIPTNTNFATVASALRAGWEVYLIDCDSRDLNASYESFLDLLNEVPDLSALCLVHIGGVVTRDLTKFVKTCEQNEILLFEDCAHAVGSFHNGSSAGSFGAASAFSFFPTKPLGVTEGGIVMTGDIELINFVESMRNQGKRGTKFGNLHEDFGGSWRMNEFSAIMCNVLMPEINQILSERFLEATKMFSVTSRFASSNFPDHMKRWSVYKYFILPSDIEHCGRLKQALAEKNIKPSGAVYERPIHKQPVFEGVINTPISLNNSEYFCPLQIVLPVPQTPHPEYLEVLESTLRETQ